MNITRLITVVVVPTLAACSWWMSGRPESNETDEIMFNHEFHTEGMGMGCTECHEGIGEATDLSAAFTPPEDTCLMCHDRDADCALCHTNPENRPARIHAPAELAFSHVEHLDRVEDECTICHADARTAMTLPLTRPTMDTCLNCHNHDEDYAEARCQPCHTTLRHLPLTAVAEFDHGGAWMERHGTMAMGAGATCFQCHVETSCNLCHSATPAAEPIRLYPEQVQRSLLHRGDWLTTHSIDARADGDSCMRCHDSAFCMSCHTLADVSAAAQNPFVRHPPGWLTPGSSDFHGTEARQRIEMCGSCHDEGASSNCVDCHRVGAAGGNPHPSDWSSRYESEDISTNPMCQICHTNGS